jgi:hypothetical protein
MNQEQIEREYLRRYRDVPMDGPAFARKLAACDLSVCRGTCCYDGVYVDRRAEEALQSLVDDRRSDFEQIGVHLPDAVFVAGDWPVGMPSSRKTATRPFNFAGAVKDFPAHFSDTSCVFRSDDGRCALQMLAIRDGVDPWLYKPVSCWLHPISISPEKITLHNPCTDPHRRSGYHGFSSCTGCGVIREDGVPAYILLSHEIRRLGELLDRDLLCEIHDQLHQPDQT